MKSVSPLICAVVTLCACFPGLTLDAQEVGSSCRPVGQVCMPFPGPPEREAHNVATYTIETYTYESDDSHIRVGAQVYTDLPAVANPPASVLRGFTRGHRMRTEEDVEVNGLSGIWVTSEVDTPGPSVWNAFAFEHAGKVYVWIETFLLGEEVGNERDVFRHRIGYLRTR